MSCGGSGWSGAVARPGGTRPGPPLPQRSPLSHGSSSQGDVGGFPKMSADVPGGSHCDPSPAFSQLPSPQLYPRTQPNDVVNGGYLMSSEAGPPPEYQPLRRAAGPPVQPTPSDIRLSTSQHTPSFYRNGAEDDQKSESPSRKRQRLVRSPVPGSLHHHSSGAGSHHHHHHHHHMHHSAGHHMTPHHSPAQQQPAREQRTRPARLPPPPPQYNSNRIPSQQRTGNLNGLGNGVVSSPTRLRQYYTSRNGGQTSSGSRHHSRGAPPPPQYPRPSTSHQPPAPVAVALDVSSTNLVPVTLSMPLYTNVPPPAPTLPPCQMPGIIWAGQASHVPPMDIFRGTRGFGECPHHHHHHHHHGANGAGSHHNAGPGLPGGSGGHHGNGAGFLGHSDPAVAAAAAVAALRATPPLHPTAPTHFAPPPPPPPDSFELEIIVDHPYHHRRAPMLQVSAAPSSLAASGILISEVPPRRPPPPPRARWPRTPIHPPPVPGLFHFLTMITSMNEAMSSPLYPQRDISHETFPDNYEDLLSLAERLGDAKPRGLTRAELDKLPSYVHTEEAMSRPGDQTSCVVCMCDFELGHTLRKLHCCHKFHSKCVDKWLKTNRTCPICRRDAAGNPPKVIFNTD